MFLNNPSIYPMGLDVSDSSLKLIQLNKIRDKIRVQAIGRADLREGLFHKGEVINKAEVVKAIKELVNKPLYGEVSTTEVVACLPETSTFIKLIEVEKSPNNLENIIEAEIEKHVPLAVDDIYYDWEIVKKLRDKLQILIGVAPRKLVDNYTSILNDAGLSVVALEVEPVAICRSMLAEENQKYKGTYENNSIIIDLGAVRTSLTVYSKNTILFTVSIPISGEEITREIAKALEIDLAQAEKAKIVCGFDESKAQGVVKNILTNVINDLTQKIKNAIDFYETHFSDRGPINHITLCGGGANIKNLYSIVNQATGIETSVGNALTNVDEDKESFYRMMGKSVRSESEKNNKSKTKIYNISPDVNSTFTTAIGLALRGLFNE